MISLPFVLTLLMLQGPAFAGEAGGAYGGATSPPPTTPFELVDLDRDGRVNEEEARSAGIEMFRDADEDRSGALDRSEFSALEDDGTLRDRCGE